MKNCLIIHGCPDSAEKALTAPLQSYNKHWIPWVKEHLIAAGIPTDNPQMPDPWRKDYDRFKEEFEKYPVTVESVLVGHSCGCAFLVRWLGETKRSVTKLILVAPWKIADSDDAHGPAFYDYDIDPLISSRVADIVMFTSDNEEEDGKKSLKLFHDVLGGKIISLPQHGHYSLSDMGTNQFPELLQEVID